MIIYRPRRYDSVELWAGLLILAIAVVTAVAIWGAVVLQRGHREPPPPRRIRIHTLEDTTADGGSRRLLTTTSERSERCTRAIVC